MSDIAIDLLEAIDARITTERESGGELEDIKSHFVLFTEADVPPEFGSQTPVLLVILQPVTGTVISIPGCMIEKEYPISFSVFTQNAGDTTSKTASELIDLVEDVFIGQTFSLSEWVDYTSKSYSQPANEPFAGDWNGFGELILTHRHVDIRGVTLAQPCAPVISPSTLVVATDILSRGYDILRIYAATAITMTSTPTIYAGTDGQKLTIQGMSDTGTVKLQDNSNLPGSLLHMAGARDFTCGLNDSIDFRYNLSQGLWIEERRADVY